VLDRPRRARERGHRSWAVTLAGNACDEATQLGEWDWVVRTVSGLGLDDSPAPWEQAPVWVLGAIKAYQGQRAEALALLDRFRSIVGSLADPQLQSGVLSLAAAIAFAEGDLVAAADAAERNLRLVDASGLPDDLLYGFIALERHDAGRARELGGRARGGRVRDVVLAGFTGGADVIEGDAAGLAAVDGTIGTLRAAGVRFMAAQFLRARAMLAPSDPGATAAAAEAAGIFRELGAVTMLRGIAELLDDRAAAPVPVEEGLATPS